MTREEVKQEFITKQPSINECESCPNKGIRLWKCAELHGCKWAQAMMEIAKMLESEPCKNCISREAALEILDDFEEDIESGNWGTAYSKARVSMCELPSVEPERKTGEWIYRKNPNLGKCMKEVRECSACGRVFCDHIEPYKNFCGFCGAKMEVDG